MTLLLELSLFVVVAIVTALGANHAVDATLAAAAFRGDVGDPAGPRAAVQQAITYFVGGVAILGVARALTARLRKGAHIYVPLSLPAALAAMGLGLAIQIGYGSPWSARWPGLPFAQGVFLACVVSAAILAIPGDVAGWLSRSRLWILGGTLLLLVVLFGLGSAPGASGQTINLFGFQPIEAVKVGAAVTMATWLGGRAAKIRFQRERVGFLRIPRPRLLAGALATLAVTWIGLFAVRDFGPTLILGAVFLGLFYVVTRSPGWVVIALSFIALCLAIFWWNPDLAPSSTLTLRVDMWRDPWLNARAHGDQLASARWALAAGGMWGAGLGSSAPGALPAGHTDLIYAHLVEELGQVGAIAYLTLLGACVLDALRVAACNRTPERALIAAALGLFLVAQAAVILLGTLGIVPLTGVVAPFLSYGKSGAVTMLGVVALIVRLGQDGMYRADTEELRELRGGVDRVRIGVAVLLIALAWVTGTEAVFARDATTLRAVITTLKDGTPVVRHDPRLSEIARKIRRGSILDRYGLPLAVSAAPGSRTNPLGDALGTVLGPATGSLARSPWSVERVLDARLRGWPDAAVQPTAYVGEIDGKRKVVFATTLALPTDEAAAALRLAARGGLGTVTRISLADPDLSPLLPLARLPLAERSLAVIALSTDTASRSVTLTLDARLQGLVAKAARDAAAKSAVGAAAVVVVDPATGQTLARAQWPDYDPGGTAWMPLRESNAPKFMGIYGAWSDKTGAHGVFQAGSVFKVLTALVAVRESVVSAGDPADGDSASAASCPNEAAPRFVCNDVTDGRTSFDLPGWDKPIHDHGDGGAKGDVDLIEGLTRSSNVYFAQLGLKLGPEAYRRLRTDGVEFGNPELLKERDGAYTGIGEGGSRRLAQTGFGQGAGSWSAAQAARVVGAVASGGVYRRCPASMEKDAPCETLTLLTPGASLRPVLAGMHGVMTRGTGARLPKVAGVRIYGKTGTADAPGTRDEAAWGIRPGKTTAPHSWFVAIAEPSGVPECQDLAGSAAAGRYVVAAVVPHGGYGASAAGPLAIASVLALQEAGYLPRE